MSFNVNSPRYQRWYVQQQSNLLQFNNTSGTWNNSGAQLIRVDANSVNLTRNAPYTRFPVLTGTASEVAGIRGRKLASWSIRGCPVIPSGTAGTAPDMDLILQNIFGQASSSTSAGSGATATYTVTGGAITGATVTAAGSGYIPGAVSITAAVGTGAILEPLLNSQGGLEGVAIINGGSGYSAGSFTITPATSSSFNTYTFLDSGYLPFSLFGFQHTVTTLTHRAMWGCFVSRATFNFNGPFLTVDLDGFGGYEIDSAGFSVFDSQAKAGLTSFPTEPSSPTTNGQPIQGFGNGYYMAIHNQDMELKIRAMSVTIETGMVPVADVFGSPYLVQAVRGSRLITIQLGDLLDDDSAALNDLKTQADTDMTGANTIDCQIFNATAQAAGNRVTFQVSNIEPNAFDLRDTGNTVSFTLPVSSAHASAVGRTDDFQLTLS